MATRDLRNLPPALGPRVRVDQVGLLVPDVDEAAESASSLLGLGPFSHFDFAAASEPTYTHRGAKATWEIRVALNHRNPQIEFIQSLKGPSVYEESIAQRGYGLHHVGFYVNDVDEVTAGMERHGYPVVQAGATPDGAFAYYETEAALGFVVEALWLPEGSPFIAVP